MATTIFASTDFGTTLAPGSATWFIDDVK